MAKCDVIGCNREAVIRCRVCGDDICSRHSWGDLCEDCAQNED